MTENERNIRAEIERQMEELNRLLDNAIDEVKAAHGLAKMVRTRFETPWRPFPTEQPPSYGDYVVTCDYGSGRYVRVANWNGVNFCTSDDFGFPQCTLTKSVTAWLPFPKPYEKGEINGR